MQYVFHAFLKHLLLTLSHLCLLRSPDLLNLLENCWHTKLASEVLVVVVLPALDALGFLHYIYVI